MFVVHRQRDSVPGFDFRLGICEDGGSRVIEVSGEIDACTAPLLREAVAAALGSSSRVCVNLAEVSFVDSSAVAVLAGAYKRARAQGCQVTLRSPTPAVCRVLRLTRLSDFIAVEDGPDQMGNVQAMPRSEP